MTIDESRAVLPVRIAVVRVLDTRTRTDDAGGDRLVELVAHAGHQVVARERVASDLHAVADLVSAKAAGPGVDCVIVIGGTGLSQRDVTPEALARVWDREIPGFGELFRMISYPSVGASAIQSRACAGLVGGVALFAIPASPGAVRDAWANLIGPQLDSRHQPCNLVEHLNCGCRE